MWDPQRAGCHQSMRVRAWVEVIGAFGFLCNEESGTRQKAPIPFHFSPLDKLDFAAVDKGGARAAPGGAIEFRDCPSLRPLFSLPGDGRKNHARRPVRRLRRRIRGSQGAMTTPDMPR
ncbi:hypothetical protein B296_00018405 [Ensete ventricosum]|uniref:Uncharacterized protein n=1 Tax=Ensete ventricosum TaxID=4639 RepID=A0A427AYG7_ENSVE|nr:hypothetical protein B296_00018405 [Ensete ventricosum]